MTLENKNTINDAMSKLQDHFSKGCIHPYMKSVIDTYNKIDWEEFDVIESSRSIYSYESLETFAGLAIFSFNASFIKYNSGLDLENSSLEDFVTYITKLTQKVEKMEQKNIENDEKYSKICMELGVAGGASIFMEGLQLLKDGGYEKMGEGFAMLFVGVTTINQKSVYDTLTSSQKMSSISQKRWEEKDSVKSYAINLYTQKSWKSPREASRSLATEVISHAKSLESETDNVKPFRFSNEDQAKDTIYKWLLEYNKNNK